MTPPISLGLETQRWDSESGVHSAEGTRTVSGMKH